jgi:hypothetical protein
MKGTHQGPSIIRKSHVPSPWQMLHLYR